MAVTPGHVPFRLFDDDTRVKSVLQLGDCAAHLIALACVTEKKSRGTGNEVDGVGLAGREAVRHPVTEHDGTVTVGSVPDGEEVHASEPERCERRAGPVVTVCRPHRHRLAQVHAPRQRSPRS